MAIVKGDARKARYWQQMLGEAARSGLSIREFCRRRRLKGRIPRGCVTDEVHVEKPWEEQPIDGLTFEGVVRSGDIALSTLAELGSTLPQSLNLRHLLPPRFEAANI
jgi:hypothetical protein